MMACTLSSHSCLINRHSWYSFIGTEDWHNEFVSPVGDSVGKTKVLLYNPNAEGIDVTIDYLDGGSTKKTVTTAVSSKRAVLSNVIPSGSGAWFNSTQNFMALSLTDTEFTTSTGQKTGSQWYDWVRTEVASARLSSQTSVRRVSRSCHALCSLAPSWYVSFWPLHS